jgi:hypothetical protein
MHSPTKAQVLIRPIATPATSLIALARCSTSSQLQQLPDWPAADYCFRLSPRTLRHTLYARNSSVYSIKGSSIYLTAQTPAALSTQEMHDMPGEPAESLQTLPSTPCNGSSSVCGLFFQQTNLQKQGTVCSSRAPLAADGQPEFFMHVLHRHTTSPTYSTIWSSSKLCTYDV